MRRKIRNVCWLLICVASANALCGELSVKPSTAPTQPTKEPDPVRGRYIPLADLLRAPINTLERAYGQPVNPKENAVERQNHLAERKRLLAGVEKQLDGAAVEVQFRVLDVSHSADGRNSFIVLGRVRSVSAIKSADIDKQYYEVAMSVSDLVVATWRRDSFQTLRGRVNSARITMDGDNRANVSLVVDCSRSDGGVPALKDIHGAASAPSGRLSSATPGDASDKAIRVPSTQAASDVPTTTQEAEPAGIVFVLDVTGSMKAQLPWVERYVQSTITDLPDGESFNILCNAEDAAGFRAFSPKPVPATPASKGAAVTFILGLSSIGAGDPGDALVEAIDERAKLIWLMTDGDVPDQEGFKSKVLKALKTNPTHINTVNLAEPESPDCRELLLNLAQVSGGVCVDKVGSNVRPHAPSSQDQVASSATKPTIASQSGEHQVGLVGNSDPKPLPEAYSVNQLVQRYEANEIAADDALKGKWFSVRGEVDRVGKDILGTPYVALKTGTPDELRGVQCFFDESHNDELARLRPGQEVTIYGRGNGLMVNVLMEDCEVRR